MVMPRFSSFAAREYEIPGVEYSFNKREDGIVKISEEASSYGAQKNCRIFLNRRNARNGMKWAKSKRKWEEER